MTVGLMFGGRNVLIMEKLRFSKTNTPHFFNQLSERMETGTI